MVKKINWRTVIEVALFGIALWAISVGICSAIDAGYIEDSESLTHFCGVLVIMGAVMMVMPAGTLLSFIPIPWWLVTGASVAMLIGTAYSEDEPAWDLANLFLSIADKVSPGEHFWAECLYFVIILVTFIAGHWQHASAPQKNGGEER